MTELGVFLSGEEQGPNNLLEQAQLAEQAGFHSVLISDHFHPWTDRQGQSPFVWGVIGAIAATTSHKVTTGVTCPLLRIHPAIIAQAAATAQIQLGGKFVLGLGTGEALNEHILGQRWPSIDVRLEMLEEAVEVIRSLWEGELVSHSGNHYTVDDAKLYSLPDSPPPIAISAFGAKALTVAADIGDGLVTVSPDADVIKSYRKQNGSGTTIGALKVCWDEDEGRARKLAHELWPTECLPGQQSQELPMPAHFAEAASIVTEDMVADKVAHGPDPERYVEAITEFLEAEFDEVYINQIGTAWPGFLEFFDKEVRPRLSL